MQNRNFLWINWDSLWPRDFFFSYSPKIHPLRYLCLTASHPPTVTALSFIFFFHCQSKRVFQNFECSASFQLRKTKHSLIFTIYTMFIEHYTLTQTFDLSFKKTKTKKTYFYWSVLFYLLMQHKLFLLPFINLYYFAYCFGHFD